jgi:hypothetical protein
MDLTAGKAAIAGYACGGFVSNIYLPTGSASVNRCCCYSYVKTSDEANCFFLELEFAHS